MKLIKPRYEIIEQGPGLQGIYDIIEQCGKTSYKSEPKGGEVAKRFVEARVKEGHGAVLEFGTVYLHVPFDAFPNDAYFINYYSFVKFYKQNKYSVLKYGNDRLSKTLSKPLPVQDAYITTNYRVLVENNRLDDLKYLCEPTEYHEKRYAVKFVVDRFTGEEFIRHRVFSFCRESSRYCNYSKDKFGGSITFVIPPWIDLPECEDLEYWDGDWVDMNGMKIICPEGKTRMCAWLWALDFAEKQYMSLTNDWPGIEGVAEEDKGPWQAQQARTVLPCAIKSPLAMCGFASDWVHFFCLRSDIALTGKPHPQAQELANPLRDEFVERGYITQEELNNRTKELKDAEEKRS